MGGTPLHYACGAGALATIEWLLEQKVPRVKDADGFVPIVRAARAAQHTAVGMMMAKGFWEVEGRSPGGVSGLSSDARGGRGARCRLRAPLALAVLQPRRRARYPLLAAPPRTTGPRLVRAHTPVPPRAAPQLHALHIS